MIHAPSIDTLHALILLSWIQFKRGRSTAFCAYAQVCLSLSLWFMSPLHSTRAVRLTVSFRYRWPFKWPWMWVYPTTSPQWLDVTNMNDICWRRRGRAYLNSIQRQTQAIYARFDDTLPTALRSGTCVLSCIQVYDCRMSVI